MRLTISPLRLELRDTFRIAREASDVRDNLLVKITDDDGAEGLGEAAPSRFYGQSADSARAALQRLQIPAGTDALLLEDLLEGLRPQLAGQGAAMAAVDMALHDLVAKKLNLPLCRFFSLDPDKVPQTSFTIGLAPLDEMKRKAQEAAGYPILKVKLGTDRDRDIIRTIRSVSDLPIRVDANASWSVEAAIRNIAWLRDEGIELVEQPVAKDDLEGLRRVTQASPLPIIADESAMTPRDVVALRGCVHGINIKLAKCGGLRQAMKMIHVARAQQMSIMLGCFIESSLGITAAAHLTPLIDFADLDGHLLIRDDPIRGVQLRNGRLMIPDRPGIGVQPVTDGGFT